MRRGLSGGRVIEISKKGYPQMTQMIKDKEGEGFLIHLHLRHLRITLTF